MSYACLHLDAKTAIACTSIGAWNALMRADPIFGRYALTDVGRSAFLAAFTVVVDGVWRVGGMLHRVDTPGIPGSGDPARIHASGTKEWWKRNQLHRIDGPAAIYAIGGEEWYYHNRLHRIGGPARTYANGNTEWFEHGRRHRIGGPACVYASYTEHWEHGVFLRCSDPP